MKPNTKVGDKFRILGDGWWSCTTSLGSLRTVRTTDICVVTETGDIHCHMDVFRAGENIGTVRVYWTFMKQDFEKA
jgi:hypothetical protein